MISVDSSALINYFGGASDATADFIHRELPSGLLVMAPVVLTELLSVPALPAAVADQLSKLTILAVKDGFWQRAGELRARLHKKKRKANLADTLIAQSCLDHDVPLLTQDEDFAAFAKYGGLKLYKV